MLQIKRIENTEFWVLSENSEVWRKLDVDKVIDESLEPSILEKELPLVSIDSGTESSIEYMGVTCALLDTTSKLEDRDISILNLVYQPKDNPTRVVVIKRYLGTNGHSPRIKLFRVKDKMII